MSQKRTTISLEGLDLLTFLGQRDANLRRLEHHFPGTLVVRGEELILEGEAGRVDQMAGAVAELVQWVQRGRILDPGVIDRVVQKEGPAEDGSSLRVSGGRKGEVYALTRGQERYLRAAAENDVVFAIGPAGTGKTYLAVVMAVGALQRREVDRILLVRPAVEAGEQLGFLPGDLQEKVNPYLRPLYDALMDTLGGNKVGRHLTSGVIEVAPLAYMRGRTLRRSFVILDEAQNTTLTQMKMFLTRIGEGTRAIVTGDVTQIDLPDPSASGLVLVQNILGNVEGVEFVRLEDGDIVRHPLVRRIVAAFDGSRDEGAPPAQRQGEGS